MADVEKSYSRDELIRALAALAWRGDFGSGDARRAALGDYYADVQRQVNLGQAANELENVDLAAAYNFSPEATTDAALSAEEAEAARIDELAARTWRGDFGNGHDNRRAIIGEADYEKVRARVNDGYEATKDVVLPDPDAPVVLSEAVVNAPTQTMKEALDSGQTVSEYRENLRLGKNTLQPNVDKDSGEPLDSVESEVSEPEATVSMNDYLESGGSVSEYHENLRLGKNTLHPNADVEETAQTSVEVTPEAAAQAEPFTDAEIVDEYNSRTYISAPNSLPAWEGLSEHDQESAARARSAARRMLEVDPGPSVPSSRDWTANAQRSEYAQYPPNKVLSNPHVLALNDYERRTGNIIDTYERDECLPDVQADVDKSVSVVQEHAGLNKVSADGANNDSPTASGIVSYEEFSTKNAIPPALAGISIPTTPGQKAEADADSFFAKAAAAAKEAAGFDY